MIVVSLDALLEKKKFVHGRWDDCYVSLADINELPAISVPDPGYWKRCEEEIDCGDGNTVGYFWYECPECGGRPLREEYNHEEALSSFCPWCGAKLGVKDEET